MSDLVENTVVADGAKGFDTGKIVLIEVDWILQHEIFSVLQRSVAAPVELKQLAVGVHHVPVGVGKVVVLEHRSDHLREEGGILVLEETEADAETFCKEVKLSRS